MEATVNTIQKVTEPLQCCPREEMKTRGPGCSRGPRGAARSSAAAFNVNYWM